MDGAGVGAVAGGVAGAFTEAGVPERDANIYSEALRRGASVLLLTVADKNAASVRSTLERFDPVDVDKAATRWESQGWLKYDHRAAPYRGTEAERERAALHGDSVVEATSGDRYRTRTYEAKSEVNDDYALRDDEITPRTDADTGRVNGPGSKVHAANPHHPNAK